MNKLVATIVAEANFIVATRDTGYRSPAAALAELIDNSLQAAAKDVSVHVRGNEPGGGLSVAVLDDGRGMDATTLRMALQFGGTQRFNDRSGPGRFGMGLPNSSVSHARRVDVYSWRQRGEVLHSHLDVDEIVAGELREVPPPAQRELPSWTAALAADAGTLVIWSKCDRLQYRTPASLVKELHPPLGRMFRYFLWAGASITLNDEPVKPVDPLFLEGVVTGAAEFSRPLTYQIRVPLSPVKASLVRVRFSELPIAKWHDLPIPTKRQIGIVKGGGVSVVRANREVAYGWYFMGGKRRENYDDWWRCEISFEPDLDEYFGVTHSKQGVNPTPDLERILSPDIEAVAHVLNSRARAEYARVRAEVRGPAAKTAAEKERQLRPIDRRTMLADNAGGGSTQLDLDRRLKYRLTVAPLEEESFYSFRLGEGELVLTINQEHPFFARIYRPLQEGASPRDRFPVECLLLALARVEAGASSDAQRYWYRQGRQTLSNVLAAFPGG